jgi:hypothetical protein
MERWVDPATGELVITQACACACMHAIPHCTSLYRTCSTCLYTYQLLHVSLPRTTTTSPLPSYPQDWGTGKVFTARFERSEDAANIIVSPAPPTGSKAGLW